ncbi:MAG: HAD family phosphatase [Erysipelotrichaceae bacterium]|nr:HAD family phosphatase [Erysipelotrichaceae bacterium]
MKAVIFDLDGVLIDSERFYMEKNIEFCYLHGYPMQLEEMMTVVGTQVIETYKLLYEKTEPDMDFHEFVQYYDKWFDDLEVDYGTIMNPHVKETLEELKKRGMKIGLASSSPMWGILQALDQCGITSYFDSVISGDEFARSKPDPEIYLTSAKKLGCPCEECLVVEDSAMGIEAGVRANMKVVALKEPFHQDQSQADYHVEDLSEILNYI